MGKFTKICLATAGIMMGVGIFLCLIGGLFGGGSFIHYAINDAYMSGRIEEFENVVETLDGAFSSRLERNAADNGTETKNLKVNGNSASDFPHEGEIPTQGIRGLELMVGAGKLVISEKDAGEDTIDIFIQGTGVCDYYVSAKDGTLYVEGFKDIKNYKGSSQNVITMRIPEGFYFKEVEAEVGAGVIEIDSLFADELETQVGAGAALLSNITVGEFSAEIGAGRMEAENTDVRDADITVNMGECVFQGSISGDLDGECGMGNLNLILSGREEDHNYELECSAGNIELGRNSIITSFASERTINNGAHSTFELVCNMGNITVDFEE